MKERPILFSGPMVKAIIAGRKTMTRRVVSKNNSACSSALIKDLLLDSPHTYADPWGYLHVPHIDGETSHRLYPKWEEENRLWVRETFCFDPGDKQPFYRATEEHPDIFPKWKPSIFMSRWASRITLEITAVRVERLQEITEEDAEKEGLKGDPVLTWWQGYREFDYGEGQIALEYDQYMGDAPPSWMIEPKKMMDRPWTRISAKQSFCGLWDSINGKKHPWESCPWVWVIEFKRIEN